MNWQQFVKIVKTFASLEITPYMYSVFYNCQWLDFFYTVRILRYVAAKLTKLKLFSTQ